MNTNRIIKAKIEFEYFDEHLNECSKTIEIRNSDKIEEVLQILNELKTMGCPLTKEK